MTRQSKTIVQFTVLLMFFIFSACNNNRTKDTDELVLSEMIIEKNGIYYSGDCETHADKKYSGTSCYYYDNGKVKGTFTIVNGLPDGHWERFDSTGKKTIDLYFDDGKLINKTFNK